VPKSEPHGWDSKPISGPINTALNGKRTKTPGEDSDFPDFGMRDRVVFRNSFDQAVFRIAIMVNRSLIIFRK
jgi:hypothetical protein